MPLARAFVNFSFERRQLVIGGVPLVDGFVDGDRSVDPGIFVFSEEAVTAFDVAFEKAVATDREKHVTGTCWSEVASWAVNWADDILMKEDHFFSCSAQEVGSLWGRGKFLIKE